MYYNGYNDYQDMYELDLGESPSLTFSYYDTTNQVFVSGLTTTMTYSNLNVNEEGYYYRRYTATDGFFYDIEFKIVFKVGDPVNGEDRVPQEHIHYNYSSTWEDQLLSYGEIEYINGVPQTEATIQEYTYDSQGNPTNITNFVYNGVTYDYATLAWSGRELTNIYVMSSSGYPVYRIEYTYNDQGYRIQKEFSTFNGSGFIINQTIDYELIDDKVVYETDGSYGILYTYDYDGTLISFNYDSDITDQNSGSEYFYIRNQMGDITHLATEDGTVVVHYVYDAYGQITDTEITAGYSAIADANPYRYRGYRFDSEISMYYLNSRYYNPEVGRFINSDVMIGQTKDLSSTNMYLYCANNPIMYVDEDGEFWNIAAGFIIGGLISATVSVASQLITTGEVDLVQTGIAFLAGGASGALAATGIGLAGSIIANAGIGGVTDTVSQLASTGSFAELDPISIVASTIMGGVAGWIGGPGMKNASNPLAQADINLSVLRQLNSEMPSQLYGDLISDTLSGIGQIAAREVGKQTGKFALGATVAGAVVTGVNIIVDFFRG